MLHPADYFGKPRKTLPRLPAGVTRTLPAPPLPHIFVKLNGQVIYEVRLRRAIRHVYLIHAILHLLLLSNIKDSQPGIACFLMITAVSPCESGAENQYTEQSM